jgi:hypothetical protein
LEFIRKQRVDPPSRWWKFKEKIGLTNEGDRISRKTLDVLRKTRDNFPYRIKFRFIPITWEDRDEGYKIEVESIPALSEKLDRLTVEFENPNIKSAVRTNKSELRDISTEMGFLTLREPFTRAENHQDTLDSPLREQLQEYKYGPSVVHFVDDADEALRYSLTRPALSAYVHGIEWAIICHVEDSENRDLMEEEGYGRGKGFTELIDIVQETGEVSQTTYEALDEMKTERIWMAHHKSGRVSEAEVRRVKQRLSIMLEELFL